MTRAPASLAVDHLSHRYPGAAAPALRDVSFRVAPGQRVGLLGPNGAGKSTLMRIVCGFLPVQARPDTKVAVAGLDAASQSLQVRPDGKITLPLVGDVNAAGLTSIELRDQLATALREYVTNPVVTVIVVETVPPLVYVMGEVTKFDLDTDQGAAVEPTDTPTPTETPSETPSETPTTREPTTTPPSRAPISRACAC